ncbi:hypothetical protein [Herbaspirillum sp. RV1423]|uniref:hypothetical protein n=1 Tax=Herbaspirillum sp. RV1423 TaxID=1443993 RepID=UPI0004B7704A|nr:hypothetical protein [Herbaspirillum sp. RV1423]
MEELLMRLAADARIQEAVAMATLDNGMHLFAYPLEQGMLIAVGIGPDTQIRPESVLSRRAGNLARYGAWLPAMFNDGSMYVLRRMVEHGDDMTVLPGDAFDAAEELLGD